MSFGYQDWARESYGIFAQLQEEGAIAPDARFMVAFPTPLALTNAFIAEEQKSLLEPVIERAVLADVEAIVDSIPNDKLAIQWDIAWEMAVLEGVAGDGLSLANLAERIARISDAIPASVPLAHHLCYAASYDQHFMDPEDMGPMVELAGAVLERMQRPLERLHAPVPIQRADEAYYLPLPDLKLGDTRLFLGLVHYEDGVEGATRRIAAAKRVVSEFGVATECGSGRTPTDPIALLRLHAEVGALAAQPLDESIEVPAEPVPEPPRDRDRINAGLRAFAERVPCPVCDAPAGDACSVGDWELERPHHDRYLRATHAQIRGELVG
jgi:hypothetical protein